MPTSARAYDTKTSLLVDVAGIAESCQNDAAGGVRTQARNMDKLCALQGASANSHCALDQLEREAGHGRR